MATIDDLRSRVRVRLEETAPAVWTDAEIDACITDALDTCSARFPREATATLPVTSGTTYVPFPSGAIAILRVTLDDGYPIPWDAFAGTIHFLDPLPTSSLSIRYTTPTTLATLPSSDEWLVVLGAIAAALERRAVQDFKRGGPPTSAAYDAVLTRAQAAFDQAMDRRGRRIRQIRPASLTIA